MEVKITNTDQSILEHIENLSFKKKSWNDFKKWQKINIIFFSTYCSFLIISSLISMKFNFITIVAFFALLFIVYYVYSFLKPKRSILKIEYELDEQIRVKFESFVESFKKANKCEEILEIKTIEKNKDLKYHSGASTSAETKKIYFEFGTPSFVETNIEIPKIDTEDGIFYFFPFLILIDLNDEKEFIEIKQSNVSNIHGNTKFHVRDRVASDTKVISTTWQYVNKDGSKDKRFENNSKVSICEYGNLVIDFYLNMKYKSFPYCSLKLLFSDANKSLEFNNSLNNYKENKRNGRTTIVNK